MDALLPRLIAHALLVAVGGWLGYITGRAMDWPALGAVTGAACGAVVFTLLDAFKALRLIGWLSGQQEKPAPRDKGFWGELGYRIEKAIRVRDKSLAVEQTRLAQFLTASDKSYQATIALGRTTDTHDATGTIISSCDDRPTRDAIESALVKYRGTFNQTPPVYSAKNIGGERSYALARKAARSSAESPSLGGTRLMVRTGPASVSP